MNILIYSVYGLTIFISAFLLFQIQPLISKHILPWFGGVASVWTICMLFFQAILFLGYLYAHLITKYLSNKKQITVHVALLIIAAISLSILPEAIWKPTVGDNPVFLILLLLSASVALPAIILSSTSPLLQSWFSKQNIEKSPYKLYAISNAGSLLALLSFPFLFEPLMPISAQANFWIVGFILFVVLCLFSGLFLFRKKKIIVEKVISIRNTEKPTIKMKLYWLILATSTSILLLAVTEKISHDISVIPFLWVATLSLYLITFVIAFSRAENEKRRNNLFPNFLILCVICLFLFIGLNHLFSHLITYLFILFLFCLACNHELVRLKPVSDYLTSFYLFIAAGGIAGGIFAGIIAPLIFNTYAELPLIIVVCVIITLIVILKEASWHWKIVKTGSGQIQFTLYKFDKKFQFSGKPQNYIFVALIVFFSIFCFGAMIYDNPQGDSKVLEKSRNFYGMLTVESFNSSGEGSPRRELISGNILHGSQLTEECKQKNPTSYYGHQSGVGLLLDRYQDKPKRVGIIGLGAGTIAAYGQSGDYFKFYEINPEVTNISKKYFTYVENSEATIDIAEGDARLSLERENFQNYNILIIDAFTNDSIPVHLLTKEAFDIYLKHLNNDGVIALNISSLYIDLTPVVLKLAEYNHLDAEIIASNGDIDQNTATALWILLSKNENLIKNLNNSSDDFAEKIDISAADLWTDDYSNIFKLLK